MDIISLGWGSFMAVFTFSIALVVWEEMVFSQ